MGQTIHSVGLFHCMCPSVCLCALSRSHFLIDFAKSGAEVTTPKSKNDFVRGQYRTTPSPILPPNRYVGSKGPENPCKHKYADS